MVLMADTLSSRSRKNNIIVTTHPPDSYREEQSLAEMRGFFVGKIFPLGRIHEVDQSRWGINLHCEAFGFV